MHSDQATRARTDEQRTADDLTIIRHSLETEIARLRHSGTQKNSTATRPWSGEVEDVADTSERIAERGYATVLTANSAAILAECEAALGRLDTDAYGVCQHCERPIGRFRLLAFPRARLCLSCQRHHETAQPSGARR